MLSDWLAVGWNEVIFLVIFPKDDDSDEIPEVVSEEPEAIVAGFENGLAVCLIFELVRKLVNERSQVQSGRSRESGRSIQKDRPLWLPKKQTFAPKNGLFAGGSSSLLFELNEIDFSEFVKTLFDFSPNIAFFSSLGGALSNGLFPKTEPLPNVDFGCPKIGFSDSKDGGFPKSDP